MRVASALIMLSLAALTCRALILLSLVYCMYWHTSMLQQKLHAVKGLSEAKVDKMVEAAKKLTNIGSWITGNEAMQKVGASAGAFHAKLA